MPNHTSPDSTALGEQIDEMFDPFNNNEWLELHLLGSEFECAHLTNKARAALLQLIAAETTKARKEPCDCPCHAAHQHEPQD